jgi:hypothetical protein
MIVEVTTMNIVIEKGQDMSHRCGSFSRTRGLDPGGKASVSALTMDGTRSGCSGWSWMLCQVHASCVTRRTVGGGVLEETEAMVRRKEQSRTLEWKRERLICCKSDNKTKNEVFELLP